MLSKIWQQLSEELRKKDVAVRRITIDGVEYEYGVDEKLAYLKDGKETWKSRNYKKREDKCS